jgi:hypothetical protein
MSHHHASVPRFLRLTGWALLTWTLMAAGTAALVVAIGAGVVR